MEKADATQTSLRVYFSSIACKDKAITWLVHSFFMFRSVFSSGQYMCSRSLTTHVHPFYTASTYFHLPVDDEPHLDEPSTSAISYPHIRSFSWDHADESSTDYSDDSLTRPSSPRSSPSRHGRHQEISDILEQKDFYNILGLSRTAASDKMELRRAYLSRSRACHPEYVSYNSRFSFRP